MMLLLVLQTLFIAYSILMNNNIAESDYEGWVAWVNDDPIFEHVEYNPRLLPIMPGSVSLEYRGKSNNTIAWKDLPHNKLTRVELYFAREKFQNQPVWRADREPGLDMLFIQMKLGSITLSTNKLETRGQQRTGLIGYRIGFWVPGRRECQMWEITRSNIKYMGNVKDPCAPKPIGFGLNPDIISRIGVT